MRSCHWQYCASPGGVLIRTSAATLAPGIVAASQRLNIHRISAIWCVVPLFPVRDTQMSVGNGYREYLEGKSGLVVPN